MIVVEMKCLQNKLISAWKSVDFIYSSNERCVYAKDLIIPAPAMHLNKKMQESGF